MRDSSPSSGWRSVSSRLLSISVGKSSGSPPKSSYQHPCRRMRYCSRQTDQNTPPGGASRHRHSSEALTLGLLQFETIFRIRFFRSSMLGMLSLRRATKTDETLTDSDAFMSRDRRAANIRRASWPSYLGTRSFPRTMETTKPLE